VKAGEKGELEPELVQALAAIYEADVKPTVHQLW
jgi:hypothetical protein